MAESGVHGLDMGGDGILQHCGHGSSAPLPEIAQHLTHAGFDPPCGLQGGATAGAAAALTAEAVREKDSKINELIEELGNKELLLSEAQSQLAAVSGWWRQGSLWAAAETAQIWSLAAWLRCISSPVC